MSDCNACISFGDGDDQSILYDVSHVKARKPHTCCECGDAIPAGTVYERSSGLQDGSWWTYATCEACADIAASLNCGSYREHTSLWESVGYVGAENIGLGCINKLTTAAGKAKLLMWRNKERGLL